MLRNHREQGGGVWLGIGLILIIFVGISESFAPASAVQYISPCIEEYKKYADALRAKVVEYQKQRKEVFDKITKQRADARKKLLEKVTPMLENYVNENNISLVLDKKSLIISTPATDITKIIVEKLNTELPSLSLK